MDKVEWAKLVGVGAYSLLEQVLGKTKYGGLIGVAKAALLFTVKLLAKTCYPQRGLKMSESVQTVGVQEVTELVVFCASLTNLGWEMGKDKKLDSSDLGKLFGAAPGLVTEGMAAFTGLDKLPAEFSDMTTVEAGQVVAAVAAKLAVTDEKAKEIIEASLELIPGIVKLVRACVKPVAVA